MAYTTLKNKIRAEEYKNNSLEKAVIDFIRERCEGLRFDKSKADEGPGQYTGTSIKANQIPYNMEKDIDRLCFENALRRFLKSGKKEDAFDVYFCYLEMFVGDYEKTRRMIELLSEYEANGSGLLMKHRDHYSHSVYVFLLGLAIYETNDAYRSTYNSYYKIENENDGAYHYLKYWGLTSLFHDIGYPFELPFEQVESYFEVNGDNRRDRPFVAYHALDPFITIDSEAKKQLKEIFGREFDTINQLFAYILAQKLGFVYDITEESMTDILDRKPTIPSDFEYFMDHAYFSATVLFKKMFEEMNFPVNKDFFDSLIAILMHNSLYKFGIANYKGENNKPFKAQLHPLSFMLMLCDELQCWDRTAYGRKSKTELHPKGCVFDFKDNCIDVVYLYDKRDIGKIDAFKDLYIAWLENENRCKENKPKLKAYSDMYNNNKNVKSDFLADIERIVDLSEIRLTVGIGTTDRMNTENKIYLSDSNFINLYNFAVVLNGRWSNDEWKTARNAGQEEKYLADTGATNKYSEMFKNLSLEYKLSNINQAKAFARFMNEIGCFYTDKPVDFDLVEHFNEEELQKIGVLEHQRWLQEHYDMGWEYGTPKKAERDLLRCHVDMIPNFAENQTVISLEEAKKNYDRLSKAEQDKDTEPMECMLAMLKMYDGLRIYRL